MVTHNVADPGFTAPTGVTGWTQLESRTTVGMTTTVWSKVLETTDPGAEVTVTADRAVRTTMTAAVWSGVDLSDPVSGEASSADAATAAHTTPQLQAASGEWVVSRTGRTSRRRRPPGPRLTTCRSAVRRSGRGRR